MSSHNEIELVVGRARRGMHRPASAAAWRIDQASAGVDRAQPEVSRRGAVLLGAPREDDRMQGR